jgi:hypothetical protein
MQKSALRSFVEDYLQAMDCQMIFSTPNAIHTQLSIEADKDLLNRPFYWMYVEQMQLPPQPQQLYLRFKPEQEPDEPTGEWIYDGSPGLQRMYQSARKRGRFVQLFQAAPVIGRNHQLPYSTWLVINFLLSYICDQKKERLVSLGMNLQTGESRSHVYDWLQTIDWETSLPPRCYLQPPSLSLAKAAARLEQQIADELEAEDHRWAEEANERLASELERLDRYDSEESTDKRRRQLEITWQYQPRIQVQVINAGLFHLLD